MTISIKTSDRLVGLARVPTISAGDLHAALGVVANCAEWVEEQIKTYGFREDIEYVRTNVTAPGAIPATRAKMGKPIYHLTIPMCDELAMLERSENGRAVRQHFRECEREAKLVHLVETIALFDLLSDQDALRAALMATSAGETSSGANSLRTAINAEIKKIMSAINTSSLQVKSDPNYARGLLVKAGLLS